MQPDGHRQVLSMTDRAEDVAVELARLRRDPHRPIGDARIAELEATARASGRELHLIAPDIDAEGGQPVIVLGWDGVEPTESANAPRLRRRRLPTTAVKVLIVLYALITDPRGVSEHVKGSTVEGALNEVAGPGAGSSAERALSTTLSRAGLVVRIGGRWTLGPVARTWDRPTNTVMTQAAERLRSHPLWPEAADE